MTPFQRLSARAWLWAWALTAQRFKNKEIARRLVVRRLARKDTNDGC